MIRPEPSVPRPSRDDLAKEVAFLPWYLRRGIKGSNVEDDIAKFKGLRGEGASPEEAYREGNKTAGSNETGFFELPSEQTVFELKTDHRLTPEALNMLKSSIGGWGGSTGAMDLDRLLKADTLFDYVPDMRKVRTSLEQPFDDAIGWNPGGGYSGPHTKEGRHTPMGVMEGYGGLGVDPNDITNPFSLSRILAHETEHPLQHKFGLPQGGDQRDPAMQKFFKEEMQPRADNLRQRDEIEREQFAADYAKSQGGGPSRAALEQGRSQWALKRPDQARRHAQSVSIGGSPRSFTTGAEINPATPLRQYQSLTGEQYADRASSRLGMSIEEMRDKGAFLAGDNNRLLPALQMLKFGPKDYQLADSLWGSNPNWWER